MVAREQPWPVGAPGWVGLTVSDVGAATGFYGDLLGWSFRTSSTPDGRPYLFATRRGRLVAGIVQAATPGVPAEWVTYLTVDDTAATVDRAEAAGGEVLMGVLPVVEAAEVAIIRDPTGAAVGVWRPGMHVGFEATQEPGTLAWVELLTDDVPVAQGFYGAVFGLAFQPLPEIAGYLTVLADDAVVGGLGPLGSMADGVDEPHWLVYFRVTDMAAALTVAETHGGRPDAPFDTEFGRLAVVRGPEGEVFALMADLPPADEPSAAPAG